jgi:hypothetical protein
MWRNVMPAHTEDTRVDFRSPASLARDAADEPTREAYDTVADLDDDAPTVHLGQRLPWPEPPRTLSERPRLIVTQRGDRTALSRSVGPALTSRPDSWFIVIGAILIAGISVFLARPPRSTPVVNAATSMPVSAPVQVRAPAPLPPPLVITVGTPPQGDRNLVASPPPRAPISVSKLPLAPRAPTASPVKRTSKPVLRMKGVSSPPSAARSSASSQPAKVSTGNAIDDGF